MHDGALKSLCTSSAVDGKAQIVSIARSCCIHAISTQTQKLLRGVQTTHKCSHLHDEVSATHVPTRIAAGLGVWVGMCVCRPTLLTISVETISPDTR